MSIEQLLERIAAALERNADAAELATGIASPTDGAQPEPDANAGLAPLSEAAAPAVKKTRGRPKASTESTQPVSTVANTAAVAPAVVQSTVPAASVSSVKTAIALLDRLGVQRKGDTGQQVMTDLIVALAGFGPGTRDAAVGILNARKVSRCSDIKAEDIPGVLNEALAALTAADAAKETASTEGSLI